MHISYFFLFLICLFLLRSSQPRMNQPTSARILYNFALFLHIFHCTDVLNSKATLQMTHLQLSVILIYSLVEF